MGTITLRQRGNILSQLSGYKRYDKKFIANIHFKSSQEADNYIVILNMLYKSAKIIFRNEQIDSYGFYEHRILIEDL